MKKVLVISLALAIMFTLAACGGTTGGNNNTNNATNPPSTAGTSNNATQATVTPTEPLSSQPIPDSSGNPGAALTASITPADGFAKNDKDITKQTYNKISSAGDMLTLTITTAPLGSSYQTIDDYIAYVQDGLKGGFADIQFSDTMFNTVNGMTASTFTYTTSSPLSTKGQYEFIENSGVAYVIIFMATSPTDAVQLLSDNESDFQSMLDSFTLQ